MGFHLIPMSVIIGVGETNTWSETSLTNVYEMKPSHFFFS